MMTDKDVDRAQDEVLLAVTDGKRVTKAMLAKLPPWRAVLLVRALSTFPLLDVTEDEVVAEATRVTGVGVLWTEPLPTSRASA